MAKNVTIAGAAYSAVPSIDVPQTGGGTASFFDVSGTTATAADVAQGKVFYAADGTETTGTASGGGGETDPADDGKTHLFLYVPRDGRTISITIGRSSSTMTGTVDWGDGSTTSITSNTLSHTYAAKGRYEIVITVTSGHIYFTSASFGAASAGTQANLLRTQVWERVYLYDANCWLGASEATPQVTFNNCSNLKKVIIKRPEITTTSTSMFASCYSLESVTLPTSLTSFANYTFRYNSLMDNVTIPASVTALSGAFNNCVNLKEVHMLPTTPPTISTSCFTGTPSDMVIYVPTGSRSDYQAAENWGTYASQMVEE